MKKILTFAIPIILCFVIAFIAGRFQSESLEYWYPLLNKSVLTPPNIVFPIAWSILYLCMGISAGFILRTNSPKKQVLLILFVIQLCLNFFWSIFFFYLQNPTAGLIDILLLDLIVLFYILTGWRTSKIAVLLFIPYFLWLCFASYLNIYILIYN